MNIKRLVITIGIALLFVTILQAAAPVVTDVVAKQRYPWNGLVDITCNVTGVDGAGDAYKFSVAAVIPDSDEVYKTTHFWVLRDGVKTDDKKIYANGIYRLVWDAKADIGEVFYSNMVVRVTTKNRHDKVQLWEGGPYWATTNIGAEEPEDYGYYFWWGDTVGYKRENGKWVASDGSSSNFSFDFGNTPTYNKSTATLQNEGWITMDGVLAPEHDAAHVKWGGDWRMPTESEFDALNNNCDGTWTTQNGVHGYIVRGKGDYASNSIFLPAASSGYGTLLYSAGSEGTYWSSVPNSDDYNSRFLCFDSSYPDTRYGYRRNGLPVRPVQGFTK